MGRMPKDMRQLMQQAQKMQAELEKTQRELAEKTYEGTAGGGVVKATVRGSGDLVEVVFDPTVLDPDDPELVGDLVVAAVNQATQAAREEMGQAMGGLSGGLDLGGLGGLLG
ncbi:MAG: YbaB/EbfC family nucleoid-associated protein [Acidimicrobiia bacterium]|nr:YbaB/EbfC family nucleoid-associated protein [Acidimicrobiia bacterium]